MVTGHKYSLTQPEATGERKPDHVAEVGLVPE